ncbi:hypothetical protein KBB08_01465 [Candidatus Gracilibacteria bacterium]|nr:hypothetical protein [Candidatus Gracilibacteria bacterium]
MAADTLYGGDSAELDRRLQPLLPQLGRVLENPPQIVTLTTLVTPQELKDMCLSFASALGSLEQAQALPDHLVDEVLLMIADLEQCRKVMETIYSQILDLKDLTPRPLDQMKSLCEQAFSLQQYRRFLDFIAYLECELAQVPNTPSSPRSAEMIDRFQSVTKDFWVTVSQYDLNAFGYVVRKTRERAAKHPTIAELPQFKANQ